jgi:hypothetical protein
MEKSEDLPDRPRIALEICEPPETLLFFSIPSAARVRRATPLISQRLGDQGPSRQDAFEKPHALWCGGDLRRGRFELEAGSASDNTWAERLNRDIAPRPVDADGVVLLKNELWEGAQDTSPHPGQYPEPVFALFP